MFWLWIFIAFIWGGCAGGIFIALLSEFKFNSDSDSLPELLFIIFICLLGPISVGVIPLIQKIIDDIDVEKGISWKIWKRIEKTTMKIGRWIKYYIIDKLVLYRKRKKDHKEMDEKEDEWQIERLGIKSK